MFTFLEKTYPNFQAVQFSSRWRVSFDVSFAKLLLLSDSVYAPEEANGMVLTQIDVSLISAVLQTHLGNNSIPRNLIAHLAAAAIPFREVNK